MSSRTGQSHSVQVPVFKFWLPLLATGALAMIFRHSSIGQVLWVVPMAGLITLYVTAAQIRPERGLIRYRRFVSWKQVQGKQVESMGYSLFPGLGQIRLDHFVPPWGRLYYVIEQDPRSVAQIVQVRAKDRPGAGRFQGWRWPIACTSAAAIGVAFWLLVGPVPFATLASSTHSQSVSALWHALEFVNRPIFHIFYGLILFVFLVRRGFHGVESVALAFLCGAIVGDMLRPLLTT